MTTLADLTSDIADEIDDTTGEYGAAILKAVQGAQRYCERELFYFNETRDQTFVTVNGREWYGAADNANIPTLVRIQELYLEDAAGQRQEMRRTTPEEIEVVSDSSGSNGEPVNWTYYAQQIRLYPVPSSTPYTVRIQIGPYRLGALSSPTDTNAWLNEAYDMLKARAKYLLYKNTLKDAALAAEALNDYEDQKKALQGETSARTGTGFVRPTSF